MNVQQRIQKKRKITSARLNLCRRIVASALLGALTILVPAIASAGPAPHREVRYPGSTPGQSRICNAGQVTKRNAGARRPDPLLGIFEIEGQP